MASVADVISSVVARRGLDCEDVSRVKAGSRVVLRVTIDGDGADGRGLSLDEVAQVSKDLSQALDEVNAMGDQPYVLEVGTRGVDKPLAKPAHWRRNTGRLVKVALPEGEPVTARIVAADDAGADLSNGQRVLFAQVVKAQVQVEMNRVDGPEDEE